MSDSERARRFKRMAHVMASMIDFDVDEQEVERASGKAVCCVCGLNYDDHPAIDDQCPTLVMTCDERFWKL